MGGSFRLPDKHTPAGGLHLPGRGGVTRLKLKSQASIHSQSPHGNKLVRGSSARPPGATYLHPPRAVLMGCTALPHSLPPVSPLQTMFLMCRALETRFLIPYTQHTHTGQYLSACSSDLVEVQAEPTPGLVGNICSHNCSHTQRPKHHTHSPTHTPHSFSHILNQLTHHAHHRCKWV